MARRKSKEYDGYSEKDIDNDVRAIKWGLPFPKMKKEVELRNWNVFLHAKKSTPQKPYTLRVEYHVKGEKGMVRQWLCFSHPEGSFPQKIAAEWWRQCSDAPVPKGSVFHLVAV